MTDKSVNLSLSDTRRAEFLNRFDGLFEHSPWVVEQAFNSTVRAGLAWQSLDADGLEPFFRQAVFSASGQRQLKLLRAHPELACAEADRESLTGHSKSEQSLAGLDQCTAEEFSEFVALNKEYAEKFGFPFILAVKGYQRQEILEKFRIRLRYDLEQEFEEALEQVCRIGRLRLEHSLVNRPERRYFNLVEPELGGAVIEVSDDFFAAAKRMLAADEAQFFDDRYDENGKWMDGWESRRKRRAGNDYCVIRICPGVIYGLEIDTSNFTGNYAPAASVEAACLDTDPGPDTPWHELLPRTELNGDSHQFLRVGDRNEWTHLRLQIYPDGGIARFRVFGVPDQASGYERSGEWIDLASSETGGEALACNDMHFGHMQNLIKPGNAINMGDGWETRRRREPGNDWAIIRLGKTGVIRRVEVDTDFFKGNYPAACTIRATRLGDDQSTEHSGDWPLLLSRVALGPDQLQVFHREITDLGPVNHVRLDIYPDGGVARLRLLGEPEGGS